MTNLFDIQGRKAIVTGATRGRGWGMAEGLMEAGAEVVIWGSSEKVNDVAREFQDRGFACHGVTANLTAPFELCQLAGREMLKEGYGKIINIASMQSFFGGFTIPAYASAKGGIALLTKALCNEWAGRGINVNAIAPGYMATEMNTALLDPANPRYKEITDRIPAHRWGGARGEDMKGPCLFLASHASDYLNGAVIPVDGGYASK